MEQTTNGTIGILALTWLIIKFGIAVFLAIFIMSLVTILINWIVETVRNKGADNIWSDIKNKCSQLTSKKENLPKQ